jgi:hypothetical protein
MVGVFFAVHCTCTDRIPFLFGTCPSTFTCAHDGASVNILSQNFNKKSLVCNKNLLSLYPKQKHYVTHTNTNQNKKSNLWKVQ